MTKPHSNSARRPVEEVYSWAWQAPRDERAARIREDEWRRELIRRSLERVDRAVS